MNHLTTSQLQKVFDESEYVISRSGYTTVMEVLSLQKKSILIPTPGQTEQEYLAQHLMQQQWCYSCNQDDDILFHINAAKSFNYQLPALEQSQLAKVIEEFAKRYFV